MPDANENKKVQKNIELIRGNPKLAIRKLSVPITFSMLILVAYSLVDSLWVAGLGSDALSALGFVTPLFSIAVGFGDGIGAGINSLISRAIGAKDKELVDNAATHSILITLVISIVLPVIIIPLLPIVLKGMGAGNTIQMGMKYSYIVFAFLFVFIFSGVASSILRAEGDVKRPMYIMILAAILNIILDPIFIYTLKMGIDGAAWATVISSTISCIIMAYWIWGKKDTYSKINKQVFQYKNAIIKDISLVAIPDVFETISYSIIIISC